MKAKIAGGNKYTDRNCRFTASRKENGKLVMTPFKRAFSLMLLGRKGRSVMKLNLWPHEERGFHRKKKGVVPVEDR